jgi:tetratricopeptide (TPR) repeat protein
MEIEETLPSLDSFDSGPSLELDLDESPAIEPDLGAPSFEPAPVSAAPPPRITPPAARAPEPPAEEGGEDLDFITEHLTEAEVFAKYGLSEKATEHLRAVIERSPKHIGAHEKLLKILLDEGDVEGARAIGNSVIKLFQERGDDDAVLNVTNDFITRGVSLKAPGAAAPRTPTIERPVPVRAPEPEPEEISVGALEVEEEELSFDLDAGDAGMMDVGLTDDAIADSAISADSISTEGISAGSFSADSPMEFDLSGMDLGETPAAPVQPPVTEPEAIEELTFEEPEVAFGQTETTFGESSLSFDEPTLSFDEPAISFEPTPAAEPELFGAVEEEEALTFGDTGPAPEPFLGFEETPSAEEIGEVDFYIAQELFDEARNKISALLARFPDNRDIVKRRDRVEAAAAAAAAIAAATTPIPPPKPAPKPAPAPPPVAPPRPAPRAAAAPPKIDIDSELLSALPDDDEDFGTVIAPPPPPPPVAAPPPPVIAAAPAVEENLFADEDDFFDLAAELETELADEDEPLALAEEEQSLEEIFKEFKKGVEQQLDSEDYDTHYNLGIAYKEMGLIDEAIGEFQLASKDPKRAVECASMLGLCFLEKGMPQLAIKWYRKGLEMPEITEEEHVGLLYDLGAAYIEVGDTDNAQKAFMEVYGMNTNYRDIVGKIKQLEDARK